MKPKHFDLQCLLLAMLVACGQSTTLVQTKINNYWTDWDDILYRYSWFLEDEA